MPNPIDVIVGQNVRSKRIAAGLSQQSLANFCGLTFQQIQKYERGENRISASRLVELSNALRCDLLDLFKGVQETSQEIETRSLQQMRTERKAVEGMNALPPAIQKALCNLMEAMTLAMGATLKQVEGRNA